MKLLRVSNIVKVVGSLSDYIFLNFKTMKFDSFFTSVLLMKKIKKNLKEFFNEKKTSR